MKFKVGDKVRYCEYSGGPKNREGVIKELPGMPEYDKAGYASADRGLILTNGRWVS